VLEVSLACLHAPRRGLAEYPAWIVQGLMAECAQTVASMDVTESWRHLPSDLGWSPEHDCGRGSGAPELLIQSYKHTNLNVY